MTELDALAREAAMHWGGTPVRLIDARENAVYEMALRDGSRAALRLHRVGYQSDAAIQSELWWCAALAARGVAVPGPFATARGDLMLRLKGGRMASAVSWMDGHPLGEAGQRLAYSPDRSLDLHRALGQLLAELHRVTDSLVLPPTFSRPRWDIDGLVGEAPFWGRFWDHPEATHADRDCLMAARRHLRDTLSAHQAKGAVLAPIHADVLRENVLVGPAGLSLIDFDDSGFGFRLYDLGTVLSQNLYEPAYTDIRDALMQGYGTQDRDLVEAMTLARCCASVGWTMPRMPPGHPVHKSHIARAVMWAARVMG